MKTPEKSKIKSKTPEKSKIKPKKKQKDIPSILPSTPSPSTKPSTRSRLIPKKIPVSPPGTPLANNNPTVPPKQTVQFNESVPPSPDPPLPPKPAPSRAKGFIGKSPPDNFCPPKFAPTPAREPPSTHSDIGIPNQPGKFKPPKTFPPRLQLGFSQSHKNQNPYRQPLVLSHLVLQPTLSFEPPFLIRLSKKSPNQS